MSRLRYVLAVGQNARASVDDVDSMLGLMSLGDDTGMMPNLRPQTSEEAEEEVREFLSHFQPPPAPRPQEQPRESEFFGDDDLREKITNKLQNGQTVRPLMYQVMKKPYTARRLHVIQEIFEANPANVRDVFDMNKPHTTGYTLLQRLLLKLTSREMVQNVEIAVKNLYKLHTSPLLRDHTGKQLIDKPDPRMKSTGRARPYPNMNSFEIIDEMKSTWNPPLRGDLEEEEYFLNGLRHALR